MRRFGGAGSHSESDLTDLSDLDRLLAEGALHVMSGHPLCCYGLGLRNDTVAEFASLAKSGAQE